MELQAAPFIATLANGEAISIVQIDAAGIEALGDFATRLSATSRHMRFFASAATEAVVSELRRESVPSDANVAVVARDGRGNIIAHAMLARIDAARAEVAFAVEDGHQGMGIATLLLGRLAEIAVARGIAVLEAYVLPENVRMLDVFRNSGFPSTLHWEDGVTVVSFPPALTAQALAHFEARDREITVASLRPLFAPRSIVIAGVSQRGDNIGASILHNITEYGYTGIIHLVHPKATSLLGRVAYASIADIPSDIDLAIIAVPAGAVLGLAEQCAVKGVRAIIVISAGFGETGAAGSARQDELVRVCRRAGIRLVGPNCLGLITTDPMVRLHATFGPQAPIAGNVAFMSQSGALGLAILEFAKDIGIGISDFISVGNKADISGNDLLQYWESDPRTSAILLYLESLGNPHKFSRLARRVSRKKPIIVVKGGRTAAGARAASSHTGALVASSGSTLDALFEQAGVIRTDTLQEMFDVASLAASQPLPAGNRVAIVTNAGGPAILSADICASHGLEVPLLLPDTMSALRALLGENAGVSNPIDMLAAATAETYMKTIAIVSADAAVDAIIVIHIPPADRGTPEIIRTIAQAGSTPNGKPVLGVYLAPDEHPHFPDLIQAAPFFTFAESAGIALAHYSRYAAWRRSPERQPAALEGIRLTEAAAIVANALAGGAGWMHPTDVRKLLEVFTIPSIAQSFAATPEDAGTLAERFGGNVAIKAVAKSVLHKTENGAVRLNIRGREPSVAAAREMQAALASNGHQVEGFLVQQMAQPGVEMIIGSVRDATFGSLIVCGAGGTNVEILNDVAVRLAPLRAGDASAMVAGLRSAALLRGYRGSAACNVSAFEAILYRIDRLVTTFPQIAELDCNPVILDSVGATVVDARIRLEAIDLPSELGR